MTEEESTAQYHAVDGALYLCHAGDHYCPAVERAVVVAYSTEPQPVGGLRHYVAEAMAKEAGSLAFRKTGTEWEHLRSVWLAHADAALNAVRRWETP